MEPHLVVAKGEGAFFRGIATGNLPTLQYITSPVLV